MTDCESRFAALCEDALATACDAPSVAAAIHCPALGVDWRGGALRGEPITTAFADVPFRIASITKPFVAAVIHRLALAGKLGVTDAIAAHVRPETASILKHDGRYDPGAIRISHLLTHTSGLPDHTATPGYQAAVTETPGRRWQRHEQIALAVSEGRRIGMPGETYAYSDTGYVILGEIVEQASGRPLAEAVRHGLEFEAIGLATTWWEALEPPPRHAPAPARLAFADGDGMDHDPSFDLFGGGGLVSTVGDLNRFFAALLTGRVLGSEPLAGALATPAALRPTDAPRWRTHNHLLSSMAVGRHWALGHTGFWSGASVRIPALGAGIAVSLNCGSPEASAAARALLDGLADTLDAIGVPAR